MLKPSYIHLCRRVTVWQGFFIPTAVKTLAKAVDRKEGEGGYKVTFFLIYASKETELI